MSQIKLTDFNPKRVASWWCTIEDLLWSEKKIVDKIKRNAESFAKADIDLAINFGFHIRFDFSNYFGQLHGYYANVCEELHKYDIKFMDHYSCNHVERPRNEEEFRKLHRNHRHHILLFHDPIAAKHAQYEGHLFRDLCEVDLRDGTVGYSTAYQLEVFCHNNPGFLDMHQKYLKRLLKEVPLDAIQVDDMCDYAGLTTCGCKYCRERFMKEYGKNIPSYNDKDFWGEIKDKGEYSWGNYENRDFRDWINMKKDSVADHLKLVKETVGEIPLMTCCSSSGPIVLNGLSLDLERLSEHLDVFMLENCGIAVNSVHWVRMDAEALHQKDIAQKRYNAPAMAISYSIYEPSAYLGWALSRYWGVSNWSSTLNQRLEEDPEDAKEIFDIIRPYNNWEMAYSQLDQSGSDLVEIRLASNKFCRENGWRDESGAEHWDKIKKWSAHFVENNIGYRFIRADELADSSALCSELTPIILDGLGCVSDQQFLAIKEYLKAGNTAWISLPFGTHDDKGVKRDIPLSEELIKNNYKNLKVIETSTKASSLREITESLAFKPIVIQINGDQGWALRVRTHKKGTVLHLLNYSLNAIPHPSLQDSSKRAVLKEIESLIKDNKLSFIYDSSLLNLKEMELLSPELKEKRRPVKITKISNCVSEIQCDLTGIKLYAVIQEK